jgi:hypothetical protein
MLYKIEIGDREFYLVRASDDAVFKVAQQKLLPGERALVYRGKTPIGASDQIGLFDSVTHPEMPASASIPAEATSENFDPAEASSEVSELPGDASGVASMDIVVPAVPWKAPESPFRYSFQPSAPTGLPISLLDGLRRGFVFVAGISFVLLVAGIAVLVLLGI